MPSSDDRFYMMEFRNRSVQWGDIGSLLRIEGLVVGGSGAQAILMLPDTGGHISRIPHAAPIFFLTAEEWSEFIRRSDNPEILVGPAKVFQRKARYEISGVVQQKVWAADGFACKYCGVIMGRAPLTVDHFVPIELGGANDTSNYLTACRSCNKDKGSEDPKSWIEVEPGIFIRGLKATNPPDDEFVYVSNTTFGDIERKWKKAMAYDS